MQTETISLDETECFSKSFIDYVNQEENLKSFFQTYPEIGNFKEIIENRNFESSKRVILANQLTAQYGELETSSTFADNISKLKDENTFTITTGHQLNIFTGPLYFIYKIVTVINACKALKKQYPEFNFVPVYWMATEDHDYDEICYFHFEGQKRTWETDQTGAVGRFDPIGIKEMAKSLPSGASFFQEAYNDETLAKAVRKYVNHLFGEEGLVVVDGDDAVLKRELAHVIEDDLFNHHAHTLVTDTTDRLKAAGYKSQVYPREINFFYLKDNIRERIEKNGDTYQVLNTDFSFKENEVKELIKNHPEQFSPNVILRPLYQELILPNLAYVGGPAETIYWLQLKDLFDHFKTPFPALMPRNFATIISKSVDEKWSKVGMTKSDLFLKPDDAISKWVELNTSQSLTYKQELEKLESLQEDLKKKASEIDPTLVQHVEALHAGFSKKVQKAEKKLLRAEKRKHEEKKNQIYSVHEALFPGGSLQERKDNFLNFYLKNPAFIEELLETFDAFDFSMYLLYE